MQLGSHGLGARAYDGEKKGPVIQTSKAGRRELSSRGRTHSSTKYGRGIIPA